MKAFPHGCARKSLWVGGWVVYYAYPLYERICARVLRVIRRREGGEEKPIAPHILPKRFSLLRSCSIVASQSASGCAFTSAPSIHVCVRVRCALLLERERERERETKETHLLHVYTHTPW